MSNQSEIYRLRLEARDRINAFYMTSYFVGAAAGSAASTFAYGHWGWPATRALVASVSVAAVASWATRPSAATRRKGPRLQGGAARMNRKDQA